MPNLSFLRTTISAHASAHCSIAAKLVLAAALWGCVGEVGPPPGIGLPLPAADAGRPIADAGRGRPDAVVPSSPQPGTDPEPPATSPPPAPPSTTPRPPSTTPPPPATTPPPPSDGGTSAAILWHDDIQTAAAPWGFDGLGIEHPIGVTVSPNDANGVNLSRVANPLPGGGFALRHFATFDDGGSRSQAGLYAFANAAFSTQAKSAEGVWVAQEWYFPQALTAKGDDTDWINLWDWHSTDTGGGNRWHTSPGLMLAEDGSMRVKWEWGGPAGAVNRGSGLSSVAMPVGQWFDIEMHYRWATGGVTISLFINGVLALEQAGVQTRASSHKNVETYMKFYGSKNGGTAWSPSPSVRYTRNVRVAAARIWH